MHDILSSILGEVRSDLWAYSALMHIVLAFVSIGLAVRLTHGAGFTSGPALIRWFQRIAFIILGLAWANCALHGIQIRQAPPLYALMTQLALMFVVATSAVRHMWSPPIPADTSWRRPMKSITYAGADSRLMRGRG